MSAKKTLLAVFCYSVIFISWWWFVLQQSMKIAVKCISLSVCTQMQACHGPKSSFYLNLQGRQRLVISMSIFTWEKQAIPQDQRGSPWRTRNEVQIFWASIQCVHKTPSPHREKTDKTFESNTSTSEISWVLTSLLPCKPLQCTGLIVVREPVEKILY